MKSDALMRLYVLLPKRAVVRLDALAEARNVDAQDLAGRLLRLAIDSEPLAPKASVQGPLPAKGEGWCQDGVPRK